MSDEQQSDSHHDADSNWDEWSAVRPGLEAALQDPNHVFSEEERRDLLLVLQRSLGQQAELHILHAPQNEIGTRKKGRGGTDWRAMVFRLDELLSSDPPMTPVKAIKKLARENNVSKGTFLQSLQKIRPQYKELLAKVESSESIPESFRGKLTSLVESLYKLPSRSHPGIHSKES